MKEPLGGAVSSSDKAYTLLRAIAILIHFLALHLTHTRVTKTITESVKENAAESNTESVPQKSITESRPTTQIVKNGVKGNAKEPLKNWTVIFTKVILRHSSKRPVRDSFKHKLNVYNQIIHLTLA